LESQITEQLYNSSQKYFLLFLDVFGLFSNVLIDIQQNFISSAGPRK